MSLEGSWAVDELAIGGELQPILDGSRITFEVDQDRVLGNSGINRYLGRVDEEGRIENVASTRMAGPHELMAQEEIFLRLLSSVEGYEEDAGRLRLLAGGLVVLELSQAVGDRDG